MKILEAWDFKTIVQASQINNTLVDNGLTWKDLDRYIEDTNKRNKELAEEHEEMMNKFDDCPCGKAKLLPVSGDGLGGEVIFACRECRYSIYDGRTMNEIMKE